MRIPAIVLEWMQARNRRPAVVPIIDAGRAEAYIAGLPVKRSRRLSPPEVSGMPRLYSDDPKRRVAEVATIPQEILANLARARYQGVPRHKSNPADYEFS